MNVCNWFRYLKFFKWNSLIIFRTLRKTEIEAKRKTREFDYIYLVSLTLKFDYIYRCMLDQYFPTHYNVDL
jgi:hypothetical protein